MRKGVNGTQPKPLGGGLITPIVRRTLKAISVPLLERLGREQAPNVETFIRLRESFAAKYTFLNRMSQSEHATEFWTSVYHKLEKLLLPTPPLDFLNAQVVMDTIGPGLPQPSMLYFLHFIQQRIDRTSLKRILRESYIGKPPLAYPPYLTTFVSIQHLFHLAFLVNRTGIRISDRSLILDWGGGYGNQAVMFQRWIGHGTYVIVDTPLMSLLQWLYISSVMGESSVNLVSSPEGYLRPGIVNLLPVSLVETRDLRPDLLLSTWGLSESTPQSVENVSKAGWLDSSHVLLAYHTPSQEMPATTRLIEEVQRCRFSVESIPFMKGSFYAYR